MLTFTAAAFLRLPFILKKCQPDGSIVFFSLPNGPLGLIAKLFFGIPYVLSLRGGDVPGLVPELELVHKIATPLRRLVLRNACAIVANAEGLQKLSEKADRYPVRVIANGVDADFFQPAPTRSTSSLSDDSLRLLFVGRLHEQKNLRFLFQQLARISAATFELQLVGDGPQKKQLQDLASELGIAQRLTWHGWVPREALPKIYQSADCLINPSQYEGMPNVVLEAMACGLPVIASDIPGNRALVLDHETGFLFDLHEPDSLRTAIEHLVKDRSVISKLGLAGRARAIAEHSWKSAAQSYVDLLNLGT
jgi:glycosyltransferase involved in cell wall biosynthesis